MENLIDVTELIQECMELSGAESVKVRIIDDDSGDSESAYWLTSSMMSLLAEIS